MGRDKHEGVGLAQGHLPNQSLLFGPDPGPGRHVPAILLVPEAYKEGGLGGCSRSQAAGGVREATPKMFKCLFQEENVFLLNLFFNIEKYIEIYFEIH